MGVYWTDSHVRAKCGKFVYRGDLPFAVRRMADTFRSDMAALSKEQALVGRRRLPMVALERSIRHAGIRERQRRADYAKAIQTCSTKGYAAMHTWIGDESLAFL